ncbi:MAG: acetyl-CoA C-acyltransferase [Deltaproteobacteria bacterium]|nr:acetyl-CoA C-acyltransferase [Deltaproteobacteria bacterium]
MQEVVVVDACRTPIGKHRGGLARVRPDDLAAKALRAIAERSKLDVSAVDEVILGCANQAGEDNRNVARMAVLLARFPDTVPAFTINRLCASGLEAVNAAARMIATGEADVVIAGGVESMTRAPFSLPKADGGWPNGNLTAYDTTLGWRYPNPAMEALFPLEPMGETAENVAEQEQVSRADQDAWALRSHQQAVAAWEAGRFSDEVVPVEIPEKKGAPTVVARDEGPRPDSSLAALGKLAPAFRKGGSVTAGNASTLNDGAAALLLMSAARCKAMGLTPLARWVGAAAAGVSPRTMGLGPVPATRKALARAGWTLDQVDLVELNEAFAAQSLACTRLLGLSDEAARAKVNVNGGAIALGHPLGCSGARILATLLHELRRRGGRRGMSSLCVGVGQGVTTLVERV